MADRYERSQRYTDAVLRLRYAASEVLEAWDALDTDLEAIADAAYPAVLPDFREVVAAIQGWWVDLGNEVLTADEKES